MAKEKQITTFLECKKTFFGKFKYYFKYSKKKNKPEQQPIQNAVEEEINDLAKVTVKNEIVKRRKKKEVGEKDNYTIEELIDIYKEFEKLEYIIKNIMMDLNSLKLKRKNMEKKFENATLFIEEIDSHKRSIF